MQRSLFNVSRNMETFIKEQRAEIQVSDSEVGG
jgi:hypothetical protein